MRNRRRIKGIVLLTLGGILLCVAALWYCANILEDKAAGEKAEVILDELLKQTEENKKLYESYSKEEKHDFSENEEFNNISESTSNLEEVTLPDVPLITINGEKFCGRIVIEKLNITLPVFWEWDYKKLKEAPCRYSGSIEDGNMIIAAHNYESHFGKLKNLNNGDIILFIDSIGREYRYSVYEISHLDGTAIEDMQAGNWAFTLFTCTKGGSQRVTVRCLEIE